MNSSSPPVLVINMTTATRRWTHVQQEIHKTLPSAEYHRIDAVDWRTLSQNTTQLPVSLFTQYLMKFPQQQDSIRISHRQVDTLSTVAILMSHMKCWQWLLDHPKQESVLILEDDACFDAGFLHEWKRTVIPMLTVLNQWDLLVLGYFAVLGSENVTVIAGTHPPVETKTVPQFYGAHAYLVTRRGAEILLKHSLPIELQVDGLFLTLFELGRLKMHMLQNSVVTQCMNNVNREGSWHTHITVRSNSAPLIEHVSGSHAVLIMVVVLFLFAMVRRSFTTIF